MHTKFRYLNPRLCHYYFQFLQTGICHILNILPVSILTYSLSSTWHSTPACQISTKSANERRSYDVIWISTIGRPQSRKYTSGFGFSDGTRFRMSKSICTPNFDEISQFTVELLLLPVSENKRPPYWNSTSGSKFEHGMAVHIGLPNFIQIGQCTGLMTSYRFSRMAAIEQEIYFRLRFQCQHLSRNVEIYLHTKF